MKPHEHSSRTESQDALSLYAGPYGFRRTSCACARPRIAARRFPAIRLKSPRQDHFINWQQDPYSNHLARLVFPKKTREFSVEVDLVADMTVINPFDFFLEKYAEEFPFEYDPVAEGELLPISENAPRARCCRR